MLGGGIISPNNLETYPLTPNNEDWSPGPISPLHKLEKLKDVVIKTTSDNYKKVTTAIKLFNNDIKDELDRQSPEKKSFRNLRFEKQNSLLKLKMGIKEQQMMKT
ncbi:MAG: hypothetical protein ACK521_07695 [bacterium]